MVLVSVRLGYPFEREWIDGGVADHVRRVLSGQALYVAPSAAFTPYIYTPLYYYLGGVVSLLLGDILVSLRLVSVLALIGSLYLIHRFAFRETG